MLAKASFLAENVQPSASRNIFCAICFGVQSAYGASRCRINHAFSANRQASRYSGMPCLDATAFTASILASETGCPPPELLVTVIITSGMRAAPSVSISRSSAATSILPLNGPRAWVSAASGQGRSTARAPFDSTFARVVSKCVLFGTSFPGPQVTWNRMRSAARPW